VTDALANAASLLLTRGDDQVYQLTEDGERHLCSLIEATAVVDDAAQLKAKVASLLGLAQALRGDEGAPLAAAAIERALHASPTAVKALELIRPTGVDDAKGRAFEAFSGSGGTVKRAPTGHEPAPPGSFKPPRPIRS